MEFDLVGHLSPYDVIHSTFEEFETVLVKSFPSNSTRYLIVEGYKRYFKTLQNKLFKID